MNRKLLSKMLKAWKVTIFHYAYIMLEAWSYRLHENGTLKIAWMHFRKVWNDWFILKTLNVVVLLLCLTDDKLRKGEDQSCRNNKKMLAPNSLPLHANPFFSLFIQQSKQKSTGYENQRDFPRLSPGKYKCISNGAASRDLFNYDNPSKKIKTIF